MNKKISAEIIADSINTFGDRITTYLLTYPRFIHAELMTHRMFSRNSASSRAIPFKRMLQMVEEDPFIPIAWQKEILYICRKIKQCIFTKQRIYSMVNFI